MVVWAFLFCVTTDAYWRILIRFSFWHTSALNFISSILFACMSDSGAVVLRMASEKPLLVVNTFSDLSAYCIPLG